METSPFGPSLRTAGQGARALVPVLLLSLSLACGDRAAAPGPSAPPVARDPVTGSPCPAPELQPRLPGDATADAAAGPSPLFRRIEVPGVTDYFERAGALPTLVDLDRDGRTDIVLSRQTSLAYARGLPGRTQLHREPGRRECPVRVNRRTRVRKGREERARRRRPTR